MPLNFFAWWVQFKVLCEISLVSLHEILIVVYDMDSFTQLLYKQNQNKGINYSRFTSAWSNLPYDILPRIEHQLKNRVLSNRELLVIWRYLRNIEGDMILWAWLIQVGQEFLVSFADNTPLEFRGKKGIKEMIHRLSVIGKLLLDLVLLYDTQPLIQRGTN